MKEGIKTLETSQLKLETFDILVKQYHCVVWSVEKIQKVKTQKLWR